MDQDFYFEESNPKWVTIIIVILVIAGLGAGYYFYKEYKKQVVKVKDVTVELGSKPSEDISSYASGATDGYTLSLPDNLVNEEGNTYMVGEYSYKIKKGDSTKRGKIFVKDTTAPNVTVKEITVGVNEEFEPFEFLDSCDDLSLPCKTSYKKDSYAKLNEKAGKYDLEIVVEDKYGNKVSKDVVLNVSETESLLSLKQNDDVVVSMTPEDKDWNKTYTYKFPKAVPSDGDEYEGKFLEINSMDFSSKFDKKITNQYSITTYNKYGYAIGISVKLFFEDNTTQYLTESDLKEEN